MMQSTDCISDEWLSSWTGRETEHTGELFGCKPFIESPLFNTEKILKPLGVAYLGGFFISFLYL